MDAATWQPGWLARQASLWAIVGSVLLYIGLALLADVSHLGEAAALAFGFQILSWGICLALILEAHQSFHLSFSDPAVLMMLWSTIYLVLPTTFWFLGMPLPWERFLDHASVVELLWLHGVFMLCLVVPYLIARPRRPERAARATIDIRTGWVLLLLPTLPLIVETLQRLASGGGLFPQATYGEWWFALQADIELSRESGGAGYIWTQISNKLDYYPLLIQGVGAGIVLAAAFDAPQRRLWRFLGLGTVVMFMLLFGTGKRTDVIIVCLVALTLSDLIGRSLRMRFLLPLLVAGLLLLDFMTVYRLNRNLPFSQAISVSVEGYSKPDYPRLNEFAMMLGKEALVLQTVKKDASYLGFSYVVNQAVMIVPSQLLPGKLSVESTGDMLSRLVLGESFKAGAGAAGAAVGDGLRMAGPFGVGIVAALLGLSLAGIERWLKRRSSLLRLALLSGVLAWTFLVIRSEPGQLLVIVLYTCWIPLVILEYLLPKIPRARNWVAPLEQDDPGTSV